MKFISVGDIHFSWAYLSLWNDLPQELMIITNFSLSVSSTKQISLALAPLTHIEQHKNKKQNKHASPPKSFCYIRLLLPLGRELIPQQTYKICSLDTTMITLK